MYFTHNAIIRRRNTRRVEQLNGRETKRILIITIHYAEERETKYFRDKRVAGTNRGNQGVSLRAQKGWPSPAAPTGFH